MFGDVSVDYYGNPLCTAYVHENADGTRPITSSRTASRSSTQAHSDGKCTSNANGEIVIPNLGPNRYAATVTPPRPANQWVQTTTLEGARDFDIWIQEGETGYDNEVVKGAEIVPMVQFGFVHTKSPSPRPRRPARSRAPSSRGCPTSAARPTVRSTRRCLPAHQERRTHPEAVAGALGPRGR